MPFGAPGAGKSHLLNRLCGLKGKFKASKFTGGGETKRISYVDCKTYGKMNPLLRIYDCPGFGDFELPMAEVLVDVRETINK